LAKRAFIISVLIASLIISTISVSSCGEKQAQLPDRQIGDQWIYKIEVEDTIYNGISEVTEMDTVDGKDCHMNYWEFEPKLNGYIANISQWIDKVSGFPVREQGVGTLSGSPYSHVIRFSITSSDNGLWPLRVGKETRVSQAMEITTKALGIENTSTERKNSTYEVLGLEEITVPAGTFECFKVIEYDETGTTLSESWWSDRVKNDVKYIDYKDGYIYQLQSYSL
jgi:hypothetical protein